MLLRTGKEDEDGVSIDRGIDPGIDTGIDPDIDPGGDPVGPCSSSSGCEINLAWVENRGEGVEEGGRGGVERSLVSCVRPISGGITCRTC